MNIPFRQPNTLIPVLMLERPDPRYQAFWEAIPVALRNRVRQGWAALPADRRRRQFRAPPRRVAGGFVDELLQAARAVDSERRAQRASKLAAARGALARTLRQGPVAEAGGVTAAPPDTPLLVHQLYQQLTEVTGCASPSEPPAAVARYAVKATRVRCTMKDEARHDEVYLLTAAVDGTGRAVIRRSRIMRMNAGDDHLAVPHHYVYPPADPAGFLDVSVELWEDDGGAPAVAEALEDIGAAIATLPDPRALGAAAVLQIAGGLVALAGALDGDDHYGTGERSWPTPDALATGTGGRFQYYDPDHGLWDTRSWHYVVDYELLALEA